MLRSCRASLPRAAPARSARPPLRRAAIQCISPSSPGKQRRSGTVININHVHKLVMGPPEKEVASDWDSVPISTEARALLQQHGVKAGTARRLHQDLGFEDVSDVRHLSPSLLSQLGLKPLELAPLMALLAQQAQQQGGGAKAELRDAEPTPQAKTCEVDVESLQRRVGLLEEQLQRRVGLLEEEVQHIKAAAKRLGHPPANRLQEGELFRVDEAHVAAVAISPDGRRVVCGNTVGDLCIYDLESFERVAIMFGPVERAVSSVAITPDGRHAILAVHEWQLRVWDLEKRISVDTLIGDADYVWAVAVTPDGQRAVSGGSGGTLHVWGLSGFNFLAKLRSGDNSGAVYSVACTPDGRHAVSAGEDATLRKWSLDTYKCVAASADDDNHDGMVHAVAISRDGRLVVTGGDDSSLGVWSLESLTRLATLKHESQLGAVTAVAVTPDCRYALCGGGNGSGGGSLHLWDLQTRTHVAALEGHTADVASVAITPDGRRAVSSCTNGAVRVWDLQGRLAHLQVPATAAHGYQAQVQAQQQAQATSLNADRPILRESSDEEEGF